MDVTRRDFNGWFTMDVTRRDFNEWFMGRLVENKEVLGLERGPLLVPAS